MSVIPLPGKAIVIRLCFSLHFIVLCACIPPRPPVTCNNFDNSCTISNAYGTWPDRVPCKASMVVYPSTEEEILQAVADGARKKLKMKVVTGFSHTIPKLACPGSGDGAGILISTQNYKNEITVDKAAMTVTADSGVGLRDLLDAVAASGLALVAAPYWDGLSLGGLLSTGSHGSSLWRRGGAVHDYVVSMRLVVPASQGEGYAKVITLRQGDPDLNAAKVSLGVLGVISKVTLALEPQFKRNVTNVVKDDADLEDDILPFAAAHEFGDLTWYPSQRKVVYRMDDRVPVTAPGNGLNDFIGFQSTAMAVIAGIRATESTLEATRSEKGKCMLARGIVASKLALANGLKNNEFMFTGYPVVGFQNRMQTSGSCQRSPSADFLSACSWDPRFKGLFFYETTAIFRLSKIKVFISDVKRLRDMEPQSFCGVDVYNGFLMRFLKGSSAYLGQAEDSVVIDFNYYRAENGSRARLNEDVWEEVEQMAFFKHGAVPHWAKNRNLAFLGAGAKYPNLNKFLRVRKKFDPDGLFSSDWSDKMLLQGRDNSMADKMLLQGRDNSMAEEKADDGCALDGMCVCEKDSHCAPSECYFCRPGKVYSEGRVCRYEEGSSEGRVCRYEEGSSYLFPKR